MANQPTKYRKFVVGAASAALVASAVAPVASAKDFSDTKGNTHEAAIDALSDAGIITGYPDGSFQPNKTLTRSDVVKLMGKWLVNAQGYEVPSDYKTNPRFADLTSSSNDELLKYAAVVKDNGVFVGTPDGKLDPAGNITRENMAIVLVRAFDRVHDIDLATYVAGQDFKKDVNDRATAKAEARPAIDVLDFFDITNPAAPAFNPKGTTTRGHFATFLHKSINTDFSDVATGVVGDATVKAVNATTVEVTFKDEVENLNSLNFTIEGLTVSNAAVKQSDNKTVVLTTAVQEGGKEYTVSLDNKEIGTFKGVSAVVPTKIDITTQSVQGKVGQQAIVSADVGVKQAGIPVTFNVKANTIGTLNKDQVFEAVTNAEGIATFSYTQYAAGTDEVTAYPTGAPSVRSLGYVFWGVDTILDVTEVTEGSTINNGANKTYKVKYLDPKTGKPVAGKRFAVSFLENIDVNVNQLANAKVNNEQPSQLLNGTAPKAAVIITDGKGEATFTVTGENTEVTPVVFEQQVVTNTNNSTSYSLTYSKDLLQTTASKVTFGAVQADYTIEMTRDGQEEAARGLANGREYKIVVKDKEGKVAKNETVNIAFNEDLDGVISTQTAAQFIKEDANDNPYYDGKQITVTTNDKGEATFVIGSEILNDYATPIAWIDINSAYAVDGKLDKGEASTVGQISYFADAKLAGAALTTYNAAGTKTTSIDAGQPATFKLSLTNQSGKSISLATAGYSHIEASYTVRNTGANVIEVAGQKVSPNRSYTVPASVVTGDSIEVTSVDGKAASVEVVANGVAKSNTTNVLDYNFTSTKSTATFTPAKAVPALYTGVVVSYNTTDKTLTFNGKDPVKYTGTGYTYFGGNGAQLANANDFIKELTSGGEAVVTRTVNEDGTVKFSIVSISTGGTAPVLETAPPAANKAPVAKTVPTQVVASNGTALTLTASELATDADGDTLSIVSAYSLNPSIATVAGAPGASISITPVATGSTTVSAVVTDGKNGFATVNFKVDVTGAVFFNVIGNPAVEYSETAATAATAQLTPGANAAGTLGLTVTNSNSGAPVATVLDVTLPASATASQIAQAINDRAAVLGVTNKITAAVDGANVKVSSVETGAVAITNSTPLADVTFGSAVAGNPIVKNPAQYSFKVADVPAAGKVVTVKIGNDSFTYTVLASDVSGGAATLASSINTAAAGNAAFTANYTATVSGDVVIFTQATGKEAPTAGKTLSVETN